MIDEDKATSAYKYELKHAKRSLKGCESVLLKRRHAVVLVLTYMTGEHHSASVVLSVIQKNSASRSSSTAQLTDANHPKRNAWQ